MNSLDEEAPVVFVPAIKSEVYGNHIEVGQLFDEALQFLLEVAAFILLLQHLYERTRKEGSHLIDNFGLYHHQVDQDTKQTVHVALQTAELKQLHRTDQYLPEYLDIDGINILSIRKHPSQVDVDRPGSFPSFLLLDC